MPQQKSNARIAGKNYITNEVKVGGSMLTDKIVKIVGPTVEKAYWQIETDVETILTTADVTFRGRYVKPEASNNPAVGGKEGDK